MFLISYQRKLHLICFLQCIADCIQTSVSGRFCCDSLTVKGRSYLSCNTAIFLLKMNFIDTVWFHNIFKCRFEQVEDLIRMKFFMAVIGNSFCCISHSFAHFWRQVQTIFCLKNISDSTLTRLAVDTDNISIVVSSDIGRVDRQIRNRPAARIFFFSPVHALCDGILMRTGECCKYKCTTVRASLIYFHSGTFFVNFTYMRHI